LLLLLFLRLLLLLLLRLRRALVFRLRLRLSTRCGGWSCWRSNTFTLWLLLPTFNLLLLSACLLLCPWLLLLWLRSRRLLGSRLLNVTCFTLFLTTTSLRLNTRLLRSLHWLLHRSRCFLSSLLLRWSTASFALVTHLELLSLRMIRRVVYTHPLREIGTERW